MKQSVKNRLIIKIGEKATEIKHLKFNRLIHSNNCQIFKISDIVQPLNNNKCIYLIIATTSTKPSKKRKRAQSAIKKKTKKIGETK